ncbi:MAG: ATP-binding protein [Myxococcota bacterium]
MQNAVDHHEESGHIAITLAVTDAGQSFELFVAGDGPGLPGETLASLDEDSFLLDSARRRGPAPGMLITAEVARRAGWSLDYRPLEPRGLSVRVTGSLALDRA